MFRIANKSLPMRPQLSHPAVISVRNSNRLFTTKSPLIDKPLRERLEKAGYRKEAIDSFSAKDLALFNKYALTQEQVATFKSVGFEDDHIQAIQANALRLGSMNDIDDGYGMSPMSVKDVQALAKERTVPRKSPGK